MSHEHIPNTQYENCQVRAMDTYMVPLSSTKWYSEYVNQMKVIHYLQEMADVKPVDCNVEMNQYDISLGPTMVYTNMNHPIYL